ncbi:MAG: imidazoleglycerol-phosphate dehydratase HisB [Coriobacteriales bacterium]|jgi:imidazoleglycerol-phosphate dehydratase
MRSAQIERSTKETSVQIALTLEGSGMASSKTGVPAFDHILEAFGRHGLFDMDVRTEGDLEIDAHHTVEDTGIALGQAFDRCLGDRRGIRRFGDCIMPMDEALIMAAVDISGRGQLHWDVQVPIEFIGNFDTSLVKEFLIALATNAGITLHVRSLAGENTHHIIEAALKAVGRALSQAVEIDPRRAGSMPSTKGVI